MYKDQSEQQTLPGKRRRTTAEDSSLKLPAHKVKKVIFDLHSHQVFVFSTFSGHQN